MGRRCGAGWSMAGDCYWRSLLVIWWWDLGACRQTWGHADRPGGRPSQALKSRDERGGAMWGEGWGYKGKLAQLAPWYGMSLDSKRRGGGHSVLFHFKGREWSSV